MFETTKQYLKEQLRAGVDMYHLFAQAGHAFASATNFYRNWSEVYCFADGELSCVDIGDRRYMINCVEYIVRGNVIENVDEFVDTLIGMEKELIEKIGHLGKKMYIRVKPTFVMDVMNRRMALWCNVGFKRENDPGLVVEVFNPALYHDRDLDLQSSKPKVVDNDALKEWEKIWG